MPSPKPCTPTFWEISPKFLHKPTQVPRHTEEMKIKTKKMKRKPMKRKPMKMKIKTTSCNPAGPRVSRCTSFFGEETSPSANNRPYRNACAPSSACKRSGWWFFLFLQRFDSEVWPDSLLSNSFNKSSPHHAQKQKANLCLPGTC